MPTPSPATMLSDRVDAASLRDVLGHFCTGVTIITGMDGGPGSGKPVGFTCQSFGSLSLEPPLVSFSVSDESTSWPAIRSSGAFCVNILAAQQGSLCRAFAQSGADKFAGVEWDLAPVTGSPRLTGAVAWVDCTVDAVHTGGDHTIVVGRVRGLGLGSSGRPAEPLLFYRSAFHGIAP